MYEAVYARPAGPSTAARQVRTAAEHGYDGVVVRNADAAVPDGVDRYGIDVVDAVEIDAPDPSTASGAVGHRRPDHTLLAVVGGTERMNRFAVEDPRVDVLVRPVPADRPDDNLPFDHVLARAAARNGLRVEFDLRPVLAATGEDRVRAIRGLRRLHRLVEQYGTPHVVTGTPRSQLAVRSPRELAAVGKTVGLGDGFVREGLSEWGRIAGRNRERTGDAYVSPGVRVERPGGQNGERSEGGARTETDATDRTEGDGG